jgi:crossover junction endodeoxyribonuclease RusA
VNQIIRVNEFPPTLNALNNMHFMVRAKLKEKWETTVSNACRTHDTQPMGKISITLEFFFADKRRRDPDNYAFSAKFLLDGLVKAGIITDDSFNEVVELRIVKSQTISKPAHILMHLQEVS